MPFLIPKVMGKGQTYRLGKDLSMQIFRSVSSPSLPYSNRVPRKSEALKCPVSDYAFFQVHPTWKYWRLGPSQPRNSDPEPFRQTGNHCSHSAGKAADAGALPSVVQLDSGGKTSTLLWTPGDWPPPQPVLRFLALWEHLRNKGCCHPGHRSNPCPP